MDPYLLPPLGGIAFLVGSLIAVFLGRAHVRRLRERDEMTQHIAAE